MACEFKFYFVFAIFMKSDREILSIVGSSIVGSSIVGSSRYRNFNATVATQSLSGTPNFVEVEARTGKVLSSLPSGFHDSACGELIQMMTYASDAGES